MSITRATFRIRTSRSAMEMTIIMSDNNICWGLLWHTFPLVNNFVQSFIIRTRPLDINVSANSVHRVQALIVFIAILWYLENCWIFFLSMPFGIFIDRNKLKAYEYGVLICSIYPCETIYKCARHDYSDYDLVD